MAERQRVAQCICGDGDGVGFCFGVKGYSDECKACLALSPSAHCIAHGEGETR